MKKRLFRLAYDVALILAFLIALPKIFYKMLVYGKYKKGLGVRFGFKMPEINSASSDVPLIWFHGASVGEVRLLLPLVHRMFKEYPKSRAVITACTEAGVSEAERLFSPLGLTAFILPLDLGWIIRPVVNLLRPSLIILSEGDCWYNFLHAAKEEVGAKVMVINGRMSETSKRRFRALKGLARNCFSPVDLFCLQDEVQKERFTSAGVPEEKIRITGNIKTAFVSEKDNDFLRGFWRERLGLAKREKLLVLGSTHRVEELLWIKAFSELKLSHPHLKVLFAPRHVERSRELEEELRRNKLLYGVWSRQDTFVSKDAIIFDKIGCLADLYAAADYAFVGGTFDPKIGGHNLLEPLFREVPLIFGPYIFSQSEIGKKILSYGCGILLGNTKSLVSDMMHILSDPQETDACVSAGRNFLENECRALEYTWKEVKDYIPIAKK
ncbi:glycosyltransferase N-terminal domain-containing protein [Chlamydiifrater phoenicopteri]|uniref:glycosyltransferase N-terminal domain-containing protein n=1 Tax=Chlamydiifrater phoenicopteri TaxID=2681469 RepID=UPI001BD09B78|nr:glycosyltransferase N-terminal domain-containing protein [Chlamydiifrater phoenicopteri]